MAPDDVPSTFTQRLRWAQGAVQVYFRSHPLRIPGLSNIQSMLFYDACASHFVAPLIIIMALVPLIFLYFGTLCASQGCLIDVLRGMTGVVYGCACCTLNTYTFH